MKYYGVKGEMVSEIVDNTIFAITKIKLLSGEHKDNRLFYNTKKNISVAMKGQQKGLTKTYSKNKEVDCTLEEFKTHLKDKCYVTSKSKGKGFCGVIKKFGWSMMPRSHGVGPVVRKGGSTSTFGLGRRMPGTKMAGRIGGKGTRSLLKIHKIDKDYLYVIGSVAGAKKSLVKICSI